MNKYQISTLQMILLQIIVAAMIIGTILAFSVVVITTQQEANAASTTFSFQQSQNNKCSGFVHCSNTGTIIVRSGSGGNGPDNQVMNSIHSS